jgi:hypothetical protein
MKKLILFSTIILSGCGTMGIGSNHMINVYNGSDDVITATGDMGAVKIQPQTTSALKSGQDVMLNSSNKKCNSLAIQREPNTPAMILDVIPGFIFGIIPILVDAVSGNLYKMPSSYTYQC